MSQAAYNIAHILPWPSIGGVEQGTLRIAQAVEGAEFTSHAFCRDGHAQVREMFAHAGFDTTGYAAVEPSYRHPQNFLRASLRLAREFRRKKIDLVHCSDLLAGYHAAFAGKLARVPVLCHIRCSYEQISRRDRSFLRAIDKFVFVSQDTWRRFGYRVASRRGTVVYDGLDVADSRAGDDGAARAVRREFGIPLEAKIVGMVGRIAAAKDYATLAKAAARVVAVYPNVRFLLIGDHTGAATYRAHYEAVRRMLEEQNLSPYFIFTGFRGDVDYLLNALDVFVLCTHTEGLPLVILEAMGQGKPVVATAVGGIPELLKHGETGLLHAHEDDAQLAASILSLLQNEPRAAGLGEAGRQFVKANFSRERFANEMKNLYRGMLNVERETTAAKFVGTPVSEVELGRRQ